MGGQGRSGIRSGSGRTGVASERRRQRVAAACDARRGLQHQQLALPSSAQLSAMLILPPRLSCA